MANTELDGESTLFHAINRNKESFAADLKDEIDLAEVRLLIENVDVVLHNFRPRVMQRLGLDYESVKKIKLDIVYAAISGYGAESPWNGKPGQDLLLQSLGGLTWLNGNAGDGPVPMGLAIADIYAGAHLVQGILACLVRKGITGSRRTGRGQHARIRSRSAIRAANRVFPGRWRGKPSAPPATMHTPISVRLTVSMPPRMATSLSRWHRSRCLASCWDATHCSATPEPSSWFEQRDEIKAILAKHLASKTTAEWLSALEPADIWCADVLDWHRLRAHEGYEVLGMEQTVRRGDGLEYRTTTLPDSYQW